MKNNLFTSLPAQVTDVSKFGSEQVISVKPAVQMPLADDKFVDIPILEDVPVIMPSAGGGLLSFPIKYGDIVLLCFSMLSIECWKNSDGSTKEPFNKRHHSLPDAIAIAGLYTKTTHLEPNTESVELKFAGCSIKQNPDGTTEVYSPSDITVTTDANMTANVLGNTTIKVGGNVDATIGGTANVSASSAVVTAATINLTGAVTITGPLTVIGPTALTQGVTVTGQSTMNGGSLNVNGGDIKNDSVSVGKSHVHRENNIEDGTTDGPS